MIMEASDEEVWAETSDDEMYNPGKLKKGTWMPKAEDILKIFDEVQAKKVLELSWKCPGRKHPDDEKKEAEGTREELVKTPAKAVEQKPTIPNEFDFDDKPTAKAVLTPRRTPGSAPRSEKKVARMDKVLKDMMQQRKQQAAEREARKQAGTKSPRNPSSPRQARISSPAGSPRTPPAVGASNRQSPVRSAPPIDPSTTPLRAPVDNGTLQPRQMQQNIMKDNEKMVVQQNPQNYKPNDFPTDFLQNTSNPALNAAANIGSSVSQNISHDTQTSVFSQSRESNAVGLPRQATPPVASSIAQSMQTATSVQQSNVNSETVNTAEHMDTS